MHIISNLSSKKVDEEKENKEAGDVNGAGDIAGRSAQNIV